MYDHDGKVVNHGQFIQVSRLANPLFNAVLVPITKKDYFSSQPPVEDHQFARYVAHRSCHGCCPRSTPGSSRTCRS